MLRSCFAFLLLVGALIGLFGVQAAYAVGPAASSMVMAAAGASSSETACADMVGQQKNSVPMPCKGLTLDCIAQMGCVVPMTIANAALASDHEPLPGEPDFWPAVSILAGGDISPEPHPPSILL
ncbi:MAG: hypothetical protein V4537_09940 [Pseudomonadota bacterium]